MLPPDPPVEHWTITLTLARINGPKSTRLEKETILRSRFPDVAYAVYRPWCELLRRQITYPTGSSKGD